jgi:hypothetical protein
MSDMPTGLEERVRRALERMSREVTPDPTLPAPIRRGVRRRIVGTAVALTTAVALLGSATVVGIRWLGGFDTQPAVAPTCSWSTVPAPTADPARFDTYLRSVTASGQDDAWAVGIYREPGEGSLVHLELQHWDGTRWSEAPVPPILGSGEGPSVFGAASTGSDDTWAVGLQDAEQGGVPLALHWDGRSWSVSEMPDTGEPESHLGATSANSSGDVWAVGNWARPGKLEGGGLALHWDGTHWQNVPVPKAPPVAETGGPYDSLESVSGSASDDVWAVGSSLNVPETTSETLTVHWDGSRWAIVPSPNVEPEPGTGNIDNTLIAVAVTAPDDAWAVGSFEEKGLRHVLPTTNRPLALHWDGIRWRTFPLPDVGQGDLNGVAAVDRDDVWAVGQTVVNSGGDYKVSPLLLHWDGSTWSRVTAPTEGDASLSAVTAIPGGGLWAVGTQGPGPPAKSLVLRCSYANDRPGP